MLNAVRRISYAAIVCAFRTPTTRRRHLTDNEFALFYANLSDADAEVHCEMADMGLPVTGGVALDMTDVFSGEHLGAQKDSFNPHIKSHDCRLFLCHLVKDNA